jgi:nifR3 family TIM-barrel protein
MEDVTNQAFRRIAKRIGRPGLVFTEFVSACAIHHGAIKSHKKLRLHAEERPVGVQIFGGDPEIMAETARVCEAAGADLVDINMGCWVPKVCRTGAGAALLRDPARAERIVAAVVRAVSVPVTVKVRAGWDWSLFAAPELAARFQDAGAQMITLHARFAKQGFEGQADWKLLESMRSAVSVPLVGNGDVRTGDDSLRMLRETGCDGVMVGRAAISNPWALRNIAAALEGRPQPPTPTIVERIETAIEHARLMVTIEAETVCASGNRQGRSDRPDDAEHRAIRALRGQLPLYVKGERGAAEVRASLSRCTTLREVEDTLRRYLSTLHEPIPEPAYL